MVENPRTETRADSLRPVNQPVPIEMDDNDPVRLRIKGRWLIVGEWRDRWRIDDEWWRGEEVSRMYFRVLMEDGREVTIFRDLVKRGWYLQTYD